MKRYDIGIHFANDLEQDRPMDRDTWLREVFPEWGTYLNRQIEAEKVEKGKLVLWWFGACSFYIKTPEDANILIDNYSGPSVYITYEGGAGPTRMNGAERQEWLRCNPHVIDPWAFTKVDALLSTHPHSDHCDIYTIKPLIKNTKCMFIGPPASCKMFAMYGAPKERILQMKPGDRYSVKDATIKATKSTDFCALRGGEVKPGKTIDEVALNYLIETPSGNVYHAGDSSYHDYYFRVGYENKIDIALINCGNSPPSFTDKMSFADAARVANQLRAKVLIPMHYDNWAITEGDPAELEAIVRMKYPKLKTFIMKWGGRFEWPTDIDKGRYEYPRQEERARPELSWEYGDKPRIKMVVE
ncbi:MAG: MBL fold metallo-hydrolase [Candidatus Bathyarchaeia archaeon]|nr:MBL fold metallo-hydrolase [Candidatus Bathyarchaeota archaeon]